MVLNIKQPIVLDCEGLASNMIIFRNLKSKVALCSNCKLVYIICIYRYIYDPKM